MVMVGAASPVAERVELHVHAHEAGVMKMKQVSGFDIPADGKFVLKPGGAFVADLMNGEKQRAPAGTRVLITE